MTYCQSITIVTALATIKHNLCHCFLQITILLSVIRALALKKKSGLARKKVIFHRSFDLSQHDFEIVSLLENNVPLSFQMAYLEKTFRTKLKTSLISPRVKARQCYKRWNTGEISSKIWEKKIYANGLRISYQKVKFD